MTQLTEITIFFCQIIYLISAHINIYAFNTAAKYIATYQLLAHPKTIYKVEKLGKSTTLIIALKYVRLQVY